MQFTCFLAVLGNDDKSIRNVDDFDGCLNNCSENVNNKLDIENGNVDDIDGSLNKLYWEFWW